MVFEPFSITITIFRGKGGNAFSGVFGGDYYFQFLDTVITLFLLKFILVHLDCIYKNHVMEISLRNCCPPQLCKYRVIK